MPLVAQALRKPLDMRGFSHIRGLTARAAIVGAFLLVSSPAFAEAGVSIPEPSDLALFGLGVLGLVLGRRGGRRKPRD